MLSVFFTCGCSGKTIPFTILISLNRLVTYVFIVANIDKYYNIDMKTDKFNLEIYDLSYIIHGFAVKVAESHIVTTF